VVLLALEDEVALAHPDPGAGGELGLTHAHAVDPGAVGGTEVDEEDASSLAADPAVAAGGVGIVENDGAGGLGADDVRAAQRQDRLAFSGAHAQHERVRGTEGGA